MAEWIRWRVKVASGLAKEKRRTHDRNDLHCYGPSAHVQGSAIKASAIVSALARPVGLTTMTSAPMSASDVGSALFSALGRVGISAGRRSMGRLPLALET
jgi:hypothetical protein